MYSRKNQIINLLKSNNYDENFINNIIKNVYSDLKNFDIILQILNHFIEEKKEISYNLLYTINYLFLNYDKIKLENFEVRDLFNTFNFWKIFLDKKVQEYVSKINLESISKEAKHKILFFFFKNYEENIFTKNFLNFIKNIYQKEKIPFFDYIRKNNLIYTFDFYKILYFIDLSFFDYYTDLYKNNFFDQILRTQEIWEIEKNQDLFFKELNKLENNIFKKFLERANWKLNLDEKLFSSLDIKKVFYSSLFLNKVFFEKEKYKDFISYLANEENILSDFDYKTKKLDFLSKNNINIFEKWDVEDIVKLLNEIHYFEVEIYLKNFWFQRELFPKYIEIFQKINWENKNIFKKFLIEGGTKILDINILFYLESLWIIDERVDIYTLEKFLDYNFNKESYENIVRFSIFFHKYCYYKWWKYCKILSKKNSKVKYCLVKSIKIMWLDYDSYEYKELREKVYFSTHFPINFIHFINYKILKK